MLFCPYPEVRSFPSFLPSLLYFLPAFFIFSFSFSVKLLIFSVLLLFPFVSPSHVSSEERRGRLKQLRTSLYEAEGIVHFLSLISLFYSSIQLKSMDLAAVSSNGGFSLFSPSLSRHPFSLSLFPSPPFLSLTLGLPVPACLLSSHFPLPSFSTSSHVATDIKEISDPSSLLIAKL